MSGYVQGRSTTTKIMVPRVRAIAHRPLAQRLTKETIAMSEKSPSAIPVLLTPKEAAPKLHCSVSYLAKLRMSGDGPPFVKRGRAVLYTELALVQWIKSRTRMSTSVVCALFALVKAVATMSLNT
jgi:hypothetical protein